MFKCWKLIDYQLKLCRNLLEGKINARWALPVYPVFKVENSNGSDEKSVKIKNALRAIKKHTV